MEGSSLFAAALPFSWQMPHPGEHSNGIRSRPATCVNSQSMK